MHQKLRAVGIVLYTRILRRIYAVGFLENQPLLSFISVEMKNMVVKDLLKTFLMDCKSLNIIELMNLYLI